MQMNKQDEGGKFIGRTFKACPPPNFPPQCDLKVPSCQAKIVENFFFNYFLKTKAKGNCFTLIKCTCKGLQKIM